MLPSLPSYAAVAASQPTERKVLPDRTVFDFSIVGHEYKYVEGKSLHIVEFQCRADTGEHAGGKATATFMWGLNPENSERSSGDLQRLAEASGFQWKSDLPSWEAFAAQFVQEPPLRFSAMSNHSVDLEWSTGAWSRNLWPSKADAEEAAGKKDGVTATRYTKARIRVNTAEPPRASSELATEPDVTPTGPPAFGAQAATGVQEEEGSDDLPF